MREVFAAAKLFQRFQDGEFLFEIQDHGPPLLREGETLPRGYRDQTIRYIRRDGRTVAIVHQRAGDAYGNPAPGTWADPKYVFFGRVRYGFSTRACSRPECECARKSG